jgi:hypothetical protein
MVKYINKKQRMTAVMMVAAGESAEAIAEQVGCHLRTA